MANIHDINRDEWMLRGPLAKKAMTGGGIQAKLWAENAVQYNRITIMQPVRVSGWMSGWMEKDGVLSSFHFNVFSNSLRI